MRIIEFNGVRYTCPLTDKFRRHTPEELDRMRESIREKGIQVPVRFYRDTTLDKPNCILDGEGRLSLAAELGLTKEQVPFNQCGKLTTDEALDIALILNDDRRQDAPEAIRQRKTERVKRVAEKRAEGKSLRTIAEEEGVSVGQVQRDIQESTVSGDTVEPPDGKVTGKDGKKRPAKRKPKGKKDKPKKPDRLKDGLGNPIPDGLADTFGDPMLAEAVERIDAAHKELVSIEQHVITTLAKKGEFWPYAQFGECAKSLKDACDRVAEASAQLANGLPFCVCPKCKGDGCKDCRNGGHWTRHRHEQRAQYGV